MKKSDAKDTGRGDSGTMLRCEDIGEVRIRRSARARSLRLRVDAGGVLAILPNRYPEKLALAFIASKKNWIRKALERQTRITDKRTVFLPNQTFQTRFHQLHLTTHNKSTLKTIVGKGAIRVWYPQFADPQDERIQTVIRRAIEEAWRVEAKRILPGRTQQLADQFGYHFNKLTIKNAKSRWGSCSAANNINLNLQLMRLPVELCDYVILHELVHTKHKNHQKPFWSELEKVLPGARKLDKQLNQYHLRYW